MLRTVVSTFCICIFDVAIAAPVPLSGHVLSEMIGGAVVEIDTPLGTKLPITYGDDGHMTGQAGALWFYLGSSRDKGKWWIASDQLCQKWETWFDGETQCMRIKKEGSQIQWASRDGKTGTGTVQLRVAAMPQAPRSTQKTIAAAATGTATASAVSTSRAVPPKPHRPVTAAIPQVTKAAEKHTARPVEVAAAKAADSEGANAAETAAKTMSKSPSVVASAVVGSSVIASSGIAESIAPVMHPRPQFSRLTAPYFAPMSLGRKPDDPAQPEVATLAPAPAPAEAPAAAAAPQAAVAPSVGSTAATVEVKRKSEAKPAQTIEVRPLPRVVAKPAQAGPAEILFKVVNVRQSDVLNVRGGPSEDHDVVGAIPPRGHGVAMTGACRSQWCPVRHEDISGWVNKAYLESEDGEAVHVAAGSVAGSDVRVHDNPEAPRGCLTPAAKELLGRIEAKFGAMQLVSTCRPGATIAGTGRPSRHRDGNAIDFTAGARKQAVVEWLAANHAQGGTMTYRDMDHIHVDIGPHFVALASGGRSDWSSERMGLSGRR